MKKRIKIIVIVLSALLAVSFVFSVLSGSSFVVSNPHPFGGTFVNHNSVSFYPSAGIFDELDNGYHFEFDDAKTYDWTYISYKYGSRYTTDTATRESEDYVTVDFDIELNEFKNKLIPYMAFTDGSKSYGTTEFITVYSDEGETIVDYNSSSTVRKTHRSLDKKIHFTFVYDFTKPTTNITCYLDGKYFTELVPHRISGVDRYTEFRFHIFRQYMIEEAGTYDITNVKLHSFSDGYKGALTEALKNHSIRLRNCSDSILYKGE